MQSPKIKAEDLKATRLMSAAPCGAGEAVITLLRIAEALNADRQEWVRKLSQCLSNDTTLRVGFTPESGH
jgi:hypothetical protein